MKANYKTKVTLHAFNKKKSGALRNGRSLDQWAEGKKMMFFYVCFFSLCLFKKIPLAFCKVYLQYEG